MKIVLLGFMGSGKSIIGQNLSEKLTLNFYDLDDLIENEAKMSISELFLTKGEVYFRKLEHLIFKDMMTNSDSFVLSLGGGTPCYAENHLMLKNQNVKSIYLSATIETLYERLKNDNQNRPLISNFNETDLKEYIAKSLFERSFFYNQVHFKLKVDNKTISTITTEIQKLLAQNS